jgi:nucleotide-binding universal stress UspA family protein
MKALVTLDDSALSLTILETARELVRLVPGAEVHLLTVLDPGQARGLLASTPEVTHGAAGTVAVSSPSPAIVESHGEALERLEREQREHLRDVAVENFPGADWYCHTRWSKDPASAIVDVARELGIDVIAMATHGRSGVSHLVAGSVTEAVIRRSGKPVLVRCPAEAASLP